jgi:hypothetical protein
MENKPATADGYTEAQTLACEQALVNLLRGFGTLKDTIRLVGGLVPRYLTPPQDNPFVPAHAGTQDVDVVLNLQVLADEGAYSTLAQQLQALKFERARNADGVRVGWRWQRQVGQHQHVVIEFLQDPLDKPVERRVGVVPAEGIAAAYIPHCGVVHQWYREIEITAELFDGGGKATEVVRFADLVAFILLKALACGQRNEAKDVGDLLHVLRYAGPLEDTAALFAQRMATGLHAEAFRETLATLHRRFCTGNGVEGHERDGPVQYARFLYGNDPDLEQERARERFFATGAVTRFLELVEQSAAPKRS